MIRSQEGESRKVAGSAKYKQIKTVLNFAVYSVIRNELVVYLVS